MKTDFYNKLKTGVLLVVTKPDQLHVMRFLEDYNKNSRDTKVFLKYRYSEPCTDKGKLLNSALKKNWIIKMYILLWRNFNGQAKFF